MIGLPDPQIPDSHGDRPLEGLRVLDLSRQVPGAYCTALLAAQGADVVKVEDTGAGDYARWAPPTLPAAEPSVASPLFGTLNAGKRSMRLDLKSADGPAVLRRLAQWADVFVESFRPGVLDRLGVGPDVLLAANPRLVIASISAYDPDGPDRTHPGHDLNVAASTGALFLTGPADGAPVPSGLLGADLAGGALHAAFGIAAALLRREHTGRGGHVEVSMSGGLLALMAPHLAAAAAGSDVRPGVAPLLGGVACYAVYPCRDGFLAVAALESQFWQALCRSLGRPDLIANQWAAPGTPGWLAVAQALSGLSRAEAAGLDRAAPCCLTPVSGIDEVLARGQADGTISAVPVARQRGETSLADCSVAVVPSAVVIDRVPPHIPEPPPLLGADTQEVLLAAGFAPVEVDGLMRTGAVAGRAAGPTGTFLGGGNPA